MSKYTPVQTYNSVKFVTEHNHTYFILNLQEYRDYSKLVYTIYSYFYKYRIWNEKKS